MYLTEGHRVSGTGTSIYPLFFTVSIFRRNSSGLSKSSTETVHALLTVTEDNRTREERSMGLLSLSLNLSPIPYTRVEVTVLKKKIKLLKKHMVSRKPRNYKIFPRSPVKRVVLVILYKQACINC